MSSREGIGIQGFRMTFGPRAAIESNDNVVQQEKIIEPKTSYSWTLNQRSKEVRT